ncbi:Thiamine biosynthesis protein (ThiI) [Malonomonas rubra DSM 5091]|uniref:Thiamine biosynthesis protein (ThiI) n=1 Tax=Malonomonas rubra DSM 5091 TaxID=1122189 RepID=A0A1M6GCV7_MALRU|nr:thiamine biosynthesis protein [Malonomonas rubra]SHJ07791.1 Thiamine biosynthesis protein (ThiI) [Malonomonas rubra DSM 5091]
MAKALGLVSGGIDSTLAVLALQRQGIDVAGVAFVTPFFGAERAKAAAKATDHKLLVRNISDVHLEMLKNPRYGYGRNMNPCIDCHAMMFRLAGEIMEQEGYDFLFSGEVLGQRPMSQNANALRSVAKLSGYADKILRPLSAKLLPITAMEENGLVDREQLLDIQGRSRKRQQQLAEEWNYPEYPSSSGGCLLTEVGFSNQLRDLLKYKPDADVNDVELLKVGRQFRISPSAKLVVGRNKADNEKLQHLSEGCVLKLRCANFSGPLGVFCGEPKQEDLETAAAILASYGKGKDEPQLDVLFMDEKKQFCINIKPMPRDESRGMILS